MEKKKTSKPFPSNGTRKNKQTKPKKTAIQTTRQRQLFCLTYQLLHNFNIIFSLPFGVSVLLGPAVYD